MKKCISHSGTTIPLEKIFFRKLKTEPLLLKDSGIVYMVECSDCPSVYVGETSQSLKKRISQHSNDVKNSICSTALSSHALENDHKFKFTVVSTFGREENNKKRRILEVINIMKKENTVNYKTDCNHLSDVYTSLLRKC